MKEIVNRLGKYALVRAVSLGLTLVLAVYLTIVIANWGGALDEVRKSQIMFEEQIKLEAMQQEDPLPPDEYHRRLQDMQERAIIRAGLHRPFPVRSVMYLSNALSLNLGRAEYMRSDYGSRQVSRILLERLPPTLLLIGTAELIVFVVGLFMALVLSRRYGSRLDRAIIALAPTSAAPGWFYGIFLLLIFAAVLQILPWGRMAAPGLESGSLEHALSVAKHMILPVGAIVIGTVFSSIYSSRTFFLIYSSEEYVELAKAKGLSAREIERRYILRPTLPPIITSFVLMIITVWMGMIVLESVFRWPGIGQAFFTALTNFDTPVIVGVVVIYGYLLAVSVFLLEFTYAALDPRVRVSIGGGQK